MVAGPAALAVALLLLPGWVYWRLEASPRTTRTALAEFFEVVAAGALATGATFLVYVSLAGQVRGREVGDLLINPADLSSAYFRHHLGRTSWSVAAFVLCACAFAALAAWVQRVQRRRIGKNQSRYIPQTPIWATVLGNSDCVLTLDLRDGRRVTGYLGGHSVDDDGPPTVYVTPPLAVQSPAASRPTFGRRTTPVEPERFRGQAVAVPGSEIVAVWREFSDQDSA